MKEFSPKIIAAYLLVFPAIYSILMLVIYQLTGNDLFLSATPLNSLLSSILVLLMLPSIAFMMNTNYSSYVRLKGQKLLSSLIVGVWIFNVVLLISACSGS